MFADETIINDGEEDCQVKHGDLSNKPSPRIVVVFEGAVGIIDQGSQKTFDRLSKRGRWIQAMKCYALQEIMLRKLLDLTYRENFNVQIVTWLGEEAASAIKQIMDEENIPVLGVFASTPSRLSRDLAYNPDIMAVYDPDPDHRFTYGSKGVVLLDPFQIGRIFGG